MKTIYTNLARFWDLGLAASGFKKGLRDYVKRLPLECPPKAKMLEVGCGTGVVTFALLEKFKDAEILATDLDKVMLMETAKLASKKGVIRDRLTMGRADINDPHKVLLCHSHETVELAPESFDLIVASGVLEYADLKVAIPALAKLLRPGGQFVVINLSYSPVAMFWIKLLKARHVSMEKVKEEIKSSGKWDMSVFPLSLREFPATLTRVGLVARKCLEV